MPPTEGPDLRRFRKLVRRGVLRFEPERNGWTPEVEAAARRWNRLALAEPTIRPKKRRK